MAEIGPKSGYQLLEIDMPKSDNESVVDSEQIELIDIQEAWNAFHDGNHISTKLLHKMIEEARAALPYLQSRGPRFYLASKSTYQDLIVLEGYLRAREKRKST